MITAYIYEIEPTNTGFIVIDQIVTGSSYDQIDQYYRWNYDTDNHGYCFSPAGMAQTKQTRFTNLG